ncbi:acylneuraminate cytidylyltransferase family protein [Roseibium denhamense]|uniref:CMP-N-acetylneuraminic acid synthetase n=1 Tax=Roseibium denhamense TaxID=76305 RepID=A0ABY1NUF8_9HYPH|nr:acylneuraminate cytidylyltransferase family protein [Roseibium denhamense]MTI05441.1 acylneuraminate cytidylyltransferase family protein [Roseibium denhamense]SMP18611.1 CMP-N-acetylneuraminic acid synthetase [Roseibium denhamense]
MTRTVAIIPARGGSKGIPGKNIKPFLGTPLVGHAIKAALGAETVTDVIVSSDDDKILRVAEAFGATPLKRPPGISGDEASSESAVLHAIGALEICQQAETLLFLQCTSPLTTSAEIDQVVRSRIELKGDTAFSVVEVHAFLWEIGEDGSGYGVNHDASKPRQRRQDRPRQYRETGAIYALDRKGFAEAGQRFFGRSVPVVLSDAVEIDLDTPRDWLALEAYARSVGQACE